MPCFFIPLFQNCTLPSIRTYYQNKENLFVPSRTTHTRQVESSRPQKEPEYTFWFVYFYLPLSCRYALSDPSLNMCMCYRRMNKDLMRDRDHLASRLFFMTTVMLIILIFLGRMGNNETGVQDRVGVLYNTLIIPPYAACIALTRLCTYIQSFILILIKRGSLCARYWKYVFD